MKAKLTNVITTLFRHWRERLAAAAGTLADRVSYTR